MTSPNPTEAASPSPCAEGPGDDVLLDVRGLRVSFAAPRRGAPRVAAVDGVDLRVRRGRTLGLVGESGSGKSTLGNAVLGLVRPDAGTIVFDGADITYLTRRQRKQVARRIQAVFQDPYGSMNPTLTVGSIVTEALRYNRGLSAVQLRDRLERALADVGLTADAAQRYPRHFSGGQRQRIAIARALVMDPEFIVCDEPTSALDLSIQAQILNLLLELQRSRGLSYLFISHDLAVVRHLADDVVVLRGGEVIEHGPADAVTRTPRHPYTQALVLAAPTADPDAQRRRREQRRLLATTAAAEVAGVQR